MLNLLPMVDLTFNEWWETGYAGEAAIYQQFEETIEDTFRQWLEGGAPERPITHSGLAELWVEVQKQLPKPGKRVKVQDGAISLEPHLVTALNIDLLEGASARKRHGVDDWGAPGFASSMTILCAKNPQAMLDIALSNLQQLLASAPIRTG